MEQVTETPPALPSWMNSDEDPRGLSDLTVSTTTQAPSVQSAAWLGADANFPCPKHRSLKGWTLQV